VARNVALDRLVAAERRGDLWSRRVLGVPVWPIERLHQFRVQLLKSELGPSAQPEARSNPAKTLASRAARSLKDLAGGGRVGRFDRDIWVLSSSNYRRPDEAGTYQCVFAEHLRSQLGERVLFLERNNATLPVQHRDDVVFIDALLLAAEAVGRSLGPIVARSPAGADARKPECPASAAQLCQNAVYIRLLLGLARKWIRQSRPEAVFVLNGYHLFLPFQIAVREAGIPLIELQHGIIHESHPGYIFDDMPELSHLPDHLLVFGRHFGELLDRESPRWRGRWTVAGQPWLKKRRRGLDELPDSAFDTVVVFSQRFAPVREVLRKLLPELRRRLSPEFRLVLKPHPGEPDAEAYYGPEAGPGVEFASPRDDTYELLRRCRLAVSPYSTVAFEALAFRCRSAVLRTRLWMDDFRTLVEQGALIAVDDAASVAALANLPPEKSRHENLANRLFGVNEPEPDFLELIRRIREERAAEMRSS